MKFENVQDAVQQTFLRRKTTLPTKTPAVFSEQVFSDETKQIQWKAFTRKLRNEYSELSLEEVIKQISRFSAPLWSKPTAEPVNWNPEVGWED